MVAGRPFFSSQAGMVWHHTAGDGTRPLIGRALHSQRSQDKLYLADQPFKSTLDIIGPLHPG